MVLIKKRNFKPYVLNWLLPKLNIGTAIGNIYYMAEAGTAMEQKLKDNGIPDSEIFHTLEAAEDATTALQNDVVLVSAGSYSETSVTGWDKSFTHLVGLNGPARPSPIGITAVTYHLDICNTTTALAEVMKVTGEGCQFHDVAIRNMYSDSACLAGVEVAGPQTLIKGCEIVGGTAATPAATTGSCSLQLGEDCGGSVIEDCFIGAPHGTTRSVAESGVIDFVATSRRPPRGIFRNCNVSLRVASQTSAGALNVGCVAQSPSRGSGDRTWLFDNCHFDAFWTTTPQINPCKGVYQHGGAVSCAYIYFRNCSAIGFQYWHTSAAYGIVFANMPITGTAGGLGVQPTGTPGY